MSVIERIKELNIQLPKPKDPVGAYVASEIVGKLLLFQDKYQLMKKEL